VFMILNGTVDVRSSFIGFLFADKRSPRSFGTLEFRSTKEAYPVSRAARRGSA
jgi:hypothetical protein